MIKDITMINLILLLTVTYFVNDVHSARILGIYPIASVSHQVVFRALTYELAKRGHELVVFTPNPGLPKNRPPDNITEIDVSNFYQSHMSKLKELRSVRGVIIRPELFVNRMDVLKFFIKGVLEDKQFKKLISDSKNNKFDLVMGEAFYYSSIKVAKNCDAPFIWFSSFYGLSDMYAVMGAPSRHVTLYPSYLRGRFSNLSLWEKVYETYMEIKFWYATHLMIKEEELLIEENFGEKVSTEELSKYVDLMFVNSHPIFELNRPLPPNIIHLGALHLQPVKELPQDLKSYLNNSKQGVVYVSLGTNVHFSAMDPTLVDVFLDAFEKLPYNVLWKFDGLDLAKNISNVKIQKWFPQRDLLSHPNIKVFVTQAGLQSTDEAIDSGVPFVALPALGDQYYNAEQYVRLGIGIQLDLAILQAEELVDAINTVVHDKSYKENVLKLRDIIRDQPQTPLERAVWWTEYVIRHKGAKHLRSPAAKMSISEYLMLDVVFVVLAVILFALMVIVKCISLILWCVFSKKRRNKITKTD